MTHPHVGDMSLQGRAFLVTGASRGIGRAVGLALGARGIGVVDVAPGVVGTDLSAPYLLPAGYAEDTAAATALRRIGEPEDVADAILGLLETQGAINARLGSHLDAPTAVGAFSFVVATAAMTLAFAGVLAAGAPRPRIAPARARALVGVAWRPRRRHLRHRGLPPDPRDRRRARRRADRRRPATGGRSRTPACSASRCCSWASWRSRSTDAMPSETHTHHDSGRERQAMRIGTVILPDARWSSAGPSWRRAEQYRFDHVWTYDHIGWLDYVDGPWFAAVPTLTAAALSTSRITLGMFVASPNFRHPVPFMRELIALDDVSGGRFVLGLGAGDDGYDAKVLGEPALTPRQRTDRFIEFVDVLDGLLTTDGFDHQGRYYTAKDARNLPGPVQQPRFDFLIAANGPRAMRLAARQGAGWATTGRAADSQAGWWKGVAELAQRFDDALAGADRERRSVARYLNMDAAPLSSLSSVEAFTETAAQAAELGFTDLVVRWPRASVADHRQESVLEQVAADVLPNLQSASANAARSS